jgi:hypothetical protein
VDLAGRWHRRHGEERKRRSLEEEKVGACVASRVDLGTAVREWAAGASDLTCRRGFSLSRRQGRRTAARQKLRVTGQGATRSELYCSR